MYRVVTSTDLGEGRVRIRVRIHSDECEPGSFLEERMKMILLQNFADNPSLLTCGLVPFQTLKMFHNGTVWVTEVEAVTEAANAKDLPSNQAKEGRS